MVVISPLISLLKDQVINIQTFEVDCVYIGENLEEGVLEKIKNGEVPILMMSPSLLGHGENSLRQKYLEILSLQLLLMKLIVWTNVHRGDVFRKDYSRISELRSLLPQAVMVALTATATKDERNRTSKLLGMNTYETIIGCCDRTNIMYFTKQASSDIEENLQWLMIDELITKKEGTPKSIIYCRNIKSCSQIYSLFQRKIGALNSYIGQPSAQNCLYAMFHHLTP